MDVKEAKETIRTGAAGDHIDCAKCRSVSFLDAIEQLKATGVREVMAYAVSNDPMDVLKFNQWEKDLTAAYAKLNALMGEE